MYMRHLGNETYLSMKCIYVSYMIYTHSWKVTSYNMVDNFGLEAKFPVKLSTLCWCLKSFGFGAFWICGLEMINSLYFVFYTLSLHFVLFYTLCTLVTFVTLQCNHVFSS
jgi:hypothetical protein